MAAFQKFSQPIPNGHPIHVSDKLIRSIFRDISPHNWATAWNDWNRVCTFYLVVPGDRGHVHIPATLVSIYVHVGPQLGDCVE